MVVMMRNHRRRRLSSSSVVVYHIGHGRRYGLTNNQLLISIVHTLDMAMDDDHTININIDHNNNHNNTQSVAVVVAISGWAYRLLRSLLFDEEEEDQEGWSVKLEQIQKGQPSSLPRIVTHDRWMMTTTTTTTTQRPEEETNNVVAVVVKNVTAMDAYRYRPARLRPEELKERRRLLWEVLIRPNISRRRNPAGVSQITKLLSPPTTAEEEEESNTLMTRNTARGY
jgi:hypothetical protein